MATIKDVARLSGVSVTTVSHVINRTRPVSDAARQRVEQAVAELRYVPSALARSLKSSRTHTIGAIIPNNSNPYFAEVLRGVENSCFEAGYSLVLCNSDDDPQRQATYVRVLSERQVDGILVMTSGRDPDLLDVLNTLTMPRVVVDRELESLSSDLVEVNHEQGGFLAASHLIGLGHRRVGCIAGPEGLSSADQRVRGYRRAMRETGLAVDERLIECADFSSQGGHDAMLRLLDADPAPTAVFASNDLMAIGAICAAASRGRPVPASMSIIGFDDIALSAHTNPPLTTVSQPKEETGALAARLLFERIADRSLSSRREMLQPVLKQRQSTARPQAGD